MKFACDTGGTFTDLVVEDTSGAVHMFKAPTTPQDPVKGVLDALAVAASAFNMNLADMLGQAEFFVHGTTHSINAIITGNTAKTAFLTTKGHPDILVIREAGRAEPFNHQVDYPKPYVPRALTFEVAGRVLSNGEIIEPLDEAAIIETLRELKALNVEAVGVCLLWSIVNAEHEARVGQLIEQHLPGVPYTLSHQLNPSLREYRRASSTCIDASLKPLMTKYMGSLVSRLQAAGFGGKVFVLTSQGGMMDATHLEKMPIHSVNSGPSMAPLGGQFYANRSIGAQTVIVADTGGTTYDVSLVRDGAIPMTRDMWIGEPYLGHMSGFPSVDVRSIGAGGGSIASVDAGGLLQVGPKSAGAVPGPACFMKGGTEPTLTDACLVLGYIDADYFLGGKMKLDVEAAKAAILSDVAEPLGMDLMEAAWSIVEVATENMVQAIADITVNQGIDPANAVLVGGGGAAGLNSVFISKRLGCKHLLIPDTGAALSAAGALISDLTSYYQATRFTVSDRFDYAQVQAVLADLDKRCEEFQKSAGESSISTVQTFVEARYESQIWEIEVELPNGGVNSEAELADAVAQFHKKHDELFAYNDPNSVVEFVTWTKRVNCKLRTSEVGRLRYDGDARNERAQRSAYFPGFGTVDCKVYFQQDMPHSETFRGPLVVETPHTTVVVDPASTISQTVDGTLIVTSK